MTSSGETALPRDLCMALPSPSTVQPWVMICRYGAAPLAAMAVSIEDWNQPRYWSPPSRYTSAGKASSSRSSNTAAWVEPESNHTSMMSPSLEKWVWPQWGQASPSGTSSSAVFSNQMLEPCCRNRSDTRRMVSGVTMSEPHCSQ